MSAADELCWISATEALDRFAARTLSPVELLDALYSRADALEPTLNSWSGRRTEQAYAAARASEARWAKGGDPARPLDGVPVAMKEEQPIAGESWQLGSLLHEHDVASITHPIHDSLSAAGAVVHARTTTPEFSCAGFTHSRLWGLTLNPWNHAISCGGSSGGSGASLAAGTTTLATGSDIGGSIRIPASLNGVVGFKPPHGRVPTLPPFNMDPYNHDGPMGRTVADVALLENVIAGPHPSDHVSMRFPPVLPTTFAPIRGMRIAVARSVGTTPLDHDVDLGTTAVIAALRAAGATVVDTDIAIDHEELRLTVMAHFGALFGASVSDAAGDRADLLTPYAKRFATRSAAVLGRFTMLEVLEREAQIQAAVAAAMHGADALVCPTLASTGWAAGEDYVEHQLVVGGVALEEYIQAALTLCFNVASRHPVLSVPSGRATNGVPTGVQVVAPTYDDATAFRIGAALERELGWWADPAWRPG